MLDIRRRTGVLLFVVTMAHIFLISAQVQSKSGVPVLQAVTFGVFARVQGGTASVIHGVRNFWGNYVGLRGVRAENEALRKQVAELEVQAAGAARAGGAVDAAAGADGPADAARPCRRSRRK